MPDLSSTRSQKDNNSTRKALRELHQTSPFALRAETSPRSSMIPWKPNLTHRRQLSLTEGKSDFLPLPVIFFGVSSAITDKTQNTGFGDKSIVSLQFPRKFRVGQLGLLSINFDFRNVIFQPMVFPFVWGKYKWKFMSDRYKLSFPRPLAASPLARPNKRTCSQERKQGMLGRWKCPPLAEGEWF